MVDYKKKPIVLYVTHYSELLGANRSLLSVVIAVSYTHLTLPTIRLV